MGVIGAFAVGATAAILMMFAVLTLYEARSWLERLLSALIASSILAAYTYMVLEASAAAFGPPANPRLLTSLIGIIGFWAAWLWVFRTLLQRRVL